MSPYSVFKELILIHNTNLGNIAGLCCSVFLRAAGDLNYGTNGLKKQLWSNLINQKFESLGCVQQQLSAPSRRANLKGYPAWPVHILECSEPVKHEVIRGLKAGGPLSTAAMWEEHWGLTWQSPGKWSAVRAFSWTPTCAIS